MKLIEELWWILDNDDKSIEDDEKYRRNIEFVHSLGLKCDCVGWSVLKLSDPRADEILSAIDQFCKTNGWKARGVYTRDYIDYESDWYELIPEVFKDSTVCDYEEVKSEQGGKTKAYILRAYHEMKASVKWDYWHYCVPERFRNACIRYNITDVDFCWAKDKGKYEAEQYFQLYANQQIPTISVVEEIDVEDKEKAEALGGYLPKIVNVFYKLQQVTVPSCYLESDMPKCSIAHAYTTRTYEMFGKTYTNRKKDVFLIHKDFAEVLLREKALPSSALRPALIVKEVPGGYILDKTVVKDRPLASFMAQRNAEYEKFKLVPRPIYAVSEKEALKLLRNAKKERKDDFQKALPKALSTSVAETEYAPMLPYYLITNGGFLSDEYELFSYKDACAENAVFFDELQAEELLEEKPNGMVIGKCPDGDKILFCKNGSVIRFSHEEPVVIEEWGSLAQFIADTVNE
ncbi:MAG: SMI1/KNR4 family protein [Clostridia bacterium]|nr:SMI1/KNR4 family protein [Clostridia bacterium]